MTTKNKIMEWEGNKYHHYILSISIRGKKNAEQLDKKKSEIINRISGCMAMSVTTY